MTLLDSLDIASTTMEYIMTFGILIAVSAVLSFFGSRGWLGRMVIASYIALVFAQFVPRSWHNFSAYADVIIFCAILMIMLFVSMRFLYAMDEWDGSWWSWQYLLFSVLALGMMISIVAVLLPGDSLRAVIGSSHIRALFVAPDAQWMWLLAPIVVATIWHRR